MNTPNIALYAGGRLRPQDIMKEMDFMRTDGFSTIILNMFHIGNPAVKAGTQLGDIIFNADDPIVIREGKYIAAPDWPGHIAELKGSGSKVTQLYACFGGAPPWVRDFETIKKIYNDNNNSFSGTQLEKNCEVFRATFPAIDGIDMDCEETYDLPSFVDFSKMLIGMGFHITLCPYKKMDFWTTALVQIEKAYPHAVKWWNLQCYDGGAENSPQVWANAIAKAAPSYQTEGCIVAGDWVRFYDPDPAWKSWRGDCLKPMEQLFSGFRKQSCVGGGFIWSLDLIRDSENRTPSQGNGCGGNHPIMATDYIKIIKRGLGPQAAVADHSQ
jgi:hypothetical protein